MKTDIFYDEIIYSRSKYEIFQAIPETVRKRKTKNRNYACYGSW